MQRNVNFLRIEPLQAQGIKVQTAWKFLRINHMDDEAKESRTINKQTDT